MAPKPPATTREVTVPNVNFDPEYLRQRAAYNRNYLDQISGLKLQRSQYGDQFAQNMQQLGWDPVTKRWKSQDPTSQYAQAHMDVMDDYAARGMGASGAQAKDRTAASRTFNQRQQQATLAKEQFGQNISHQGTVAGNTRDQATANAKASAVQAIAAKYGVDTGVIPKDPKGKKTSKVKIPVNT